MKAALLREPRRIDLIEVETPEPGPGHETQERSLELVRGAPSALDGVSVVVEPNISCRRCEWCAAGLPNICPQYRVLGEAGDVPGGLAEYVVVAADQVYRLPSGLSAAEGAVIQPLSISYHGIVNRGQVREGESVLVLGAGPIGLAALLVASDLAAQVIVADVVDDRLEVARRLGAFACLRADTHADCLP